jgi:tRNA(Ile)-lysidine synthase
MEAPAVRRVHFAVRQAVARHALWTTGATLVVGVSGGPDSLCLLGALVALRCAGDPLAPGGLVVAHLDHGLRGEAGAADADWVRAFCEALGLRCVVERGHVREMASADRRSIEDAARRVRYGFLRHVARAERAARICVGHTRDDQAETVLLHLLRGAGLSGLAGMSPLEGDVARPLLDVTHAETMAYCAALGWEPRADESNASRDFTRNRVRLDLLPALAAHNPRIARTLAENAALIRADDEYLDSLVDAVWTEPLVVRAGPDEVILSRRTLESLPLALRHRVLRRAAHALAGEDASPSARQIVAFDALLAGQASGRVLDLHGYLRVAVGYDTVEIVRQRAAHADRRARGAHTEEEHAKEADDASWPLAVPGAVDLPRAGWRVRAWLSDLPPGMEPQALPQSDAIPPLAHAGTVAALPYAERRAYLDADAASEELSVRLWRPGDSFQPLGMEREKKLQDFFADAKVPRDFRRTLPLVINPRHIVWVAGLRPDHRARLTEGTRRVLVLQLDPLAAPSDTTA